MNHAIQFTKKMLLVFCLVIATNLHAQELASMAITDTAQLREAIVALREYGNNLAPMRGVFDEREFEQARANRASWGHLADALELSLRFKTGHLLSTTGASMIQIALKEKERLDEYYATDEYKRISWKEDHPTYLMKNGDTVEYPKGSTEVMWSDNGQETEVGFKVKKKEVWFKKIGPGTYMEAK